MRKVLLAGLAGLMIAGPVLAQERRDYQGDRREWQGGRDDRGDQRRDYQGDHRDDRGGTRRDDWRGNDRHDNNRRDNDWRRDDRRGSDWRWNGNRYRGPAYVHPRGYGYQSWGVGIRVPQAYFGNRYWIGDPGYYRLPPAYQGTRWIRVGPDALLIDLRAGVVIRAVRGLYW